MQIGVALPRLASWERVAAMARRGEELGLSSLWLSDPADVIPDVGPYDGLEPLVAMAGLAQVTRRAGIGALLQSTLRPPAVAAKALATADVLSGGRAMVVLEDPRTDAADAVEEEVQVMRGAFGGGPFSFHGDHHRVEGLRCRPRPVQRSGPSVWVRGDDQRLMAAAARQAGGWGPAGWTATVHQYRRLAEAVDEACREAGRDPATLARFVCQGAADSAEAVRAQASAWEGVGVATLIMGCGEVAFPESSDRALEGHLEAVASVVSATT